MFNTVQWRPLSLRGALGLLALGLLAAGCKSDTGGSKTPSITCKGASCKPDGSASSDDDPGDGDGDLDDRDGGGDGDGDVAMDRPSEPLAGCTPTRKAIALYPGAMPATDAAGEAPMTCAMGTGKNAPFNTAIAVNKSGSVFFAPALAAGVMRSRDNGKTWEGPLNNPPGPKDGNWGHPFLWRDPTTERLFFTLYNSFAGPCFGGTGHDGWFSDDDGSNWTKIEGGVGCGSWDWGKIVTGPARLDATKEKLKANGYPNVVYFCAGGPTYAIGPNHFCYRSLDGGQTFTRTKSDAIDPTRGEAGWPNAGYVAPDGTFYKAHPSDQGLTLSTTEDEGDSWHGTPVPNTNFTGNPTTLNFLSSNVTGDAAGNLYVVWVDDADLNPYLAYSKDRGATWSNPIHVGAPGVRASSCVNVSVKQPGYVAIAYYGSQQAESTAGNGHTTNDERPYDAYLTVSTNVFVERPLFWSTTINQPGKPAIPGISLLVSEYVGAPAFGPDGSIWIGFLQDSDGLVGRMTPPPK